MSLTIPSQLAPKVTRSSRPGVVFRGRLDHVSKDNVCFGSQQKKTDEQKPSFFSRALVWGGALTAIVSTGLLIAGLGLTAPIAIPLILAGVLACIIGLIISSKKAKTPELSVSSMDSLAVKPTEPAKQDKWLAKINHWFDEWKNRDCPFPSLRQCFEALSNLPRGIKLKNQIYGFYQPILRKIFLNPEVMNPEEIPEEMQDIVVKPLISHEGTHAAHDILRRKFWLTYPKEALQIVRDEIVQLVKHGDKTLCIPLSNEEQDPLNTQLLLKNNAIYTEISHTLLSGANNELITESGFTAKGKDYLRTKITPEIAHLFYKSSTVEQAIESLEKKLVSQVFQRCAPYSFIPTPYLPREFREALAQSVANAFQVSDTKDATVEIDPLLDTRAGQKVIDFYGSRDEAHQQVSDYVRSILNRYTSTLSFQTMFLPEKQKKQLSQVKLTPREETQARESIKGALSTLTGNLIAQYHPAGFNSLTGMLAYQIFAWEELQAQRTQVRLLNRLLVEKTRAQGETLEIDDAADEAFYNKLQEFTDLQPEFLTANPNFGHPIASYTFLYSPSTVRCNPDFSQHVREQLEASCSPLDRTDYQERLRTLSRTNPDSVASYASSIAEILTAFNMASPGVVHSYYPIMKSLEALYGDIYRMLEPPI